MFYTPFCWCDFWYLKIEPSLFLLFAKCPYMLLPSHSFVGWILLRSIHIVHFCLHLCLLHTMGIFWLLPYLVNFFVLCILVFSFFLLGCICLLICIFLCLLKCSILVLLSVHLLLFWNYLLALLFLKFGHLLRLVHHIIEFCCLFCRFLLFELFFDMFLH